MATLNKAISEQAEGIVRNLRNLCSTIVIKYIIRTMSDTQSAPGIYAQNSGTGDECVSKFQNELYSAISDGKTARIEVEFIKPKTKELLSSHKLVIRDAFPRVLDEPEPPKTQPQEPPKQQQQPNNMMGNLSGVLQLLGYQDQCSGLNGTGNDPFAGLGAILAIRDQRIEEKFRAEKRDEDFGKLKAENELLEAENKRLKATVEEQDDKIAEYEEDLAELEKLRPENSIAGVSLVGLGSSILQNVIKKNAAVIGGLMGIDKDTALSLFSGDDAQQQSVQPTMQQPTPEPVPVEVSETVNDPRAEYYKAIMEFCKALPDDKFISLYKILQEFAKNTEQITETLNYVSNTEENGEV